MHAPNSASAAEFSRIARRNRSISVTGVSVVFGSLIAVALAVGIGFAALGAWLVLPFAGIEVAALGAALTWIFRHALDYERICLRGGLLEVEVVDGRRRTRREFNPAWARVVFEAQGNRARLALRSHGRELEIGRHLSADDRLGLARELGELGLQRA
jgi:uncharacterized membrane protein